MNAAELKNSLAQFSGSERFTKYSQALFPKTVITEGVLYLAEKAGCYWLLDLISSWQSDSRVSAESFQVWKLSKDDDGEWSVVFGDGNNDKDFVIQNGEFTDFPLGSMKLFAVNDGETLTILLPQEY